MRTLTITSWLKDFEAHLSAAEANDKTLSQITAFRQGFEGWLKFEMARLPPKRLTQYHPWIGNAAGDVGVEYRAILIGEGTKLVDLWASPTPGAKEWNFIELKVAFNNFNATKQFASWRADFEALRRIDKTIPGQQVAEIGSIVFAVGFEDPKFDALVDASALPGAAVRPAWSARIPLSNGHLRIAALIE